jgi:hypothetical protein
MSGRSSEKQNSRGPRGGRQATPYVFNDENGAAWLLGLCIGAALQGGAVRVGLSRDLGVLALGIYKGDDYKTEYVRPEEDLAQAVREISQAWGFDVVAFDVEAGVYKVP